MSATTLKEFEAMGVDTGGKSFRDGQQYINKFKGLAEWKGKVNFIVNWAKFNEVKCRG
jgi:hypothetical protein